jgi:CHAD domain-containing protein
MDAGYRALAAKYIRRQAKQLVEQLDGLRAAEDIEFVHRARVATRRLRAALRLFGECFPCKQLRRWRKAIGRTTAKLGDARDRDVQIEFLCGILSALGAKECFPGISRLLVEIERDRERLQRKVVKAVDRLEAKGILRHVRRVSKKLVPEEASPAEDVPSPDACTQTRQHILEQLDELLSHQDSLASPDDCERHHAMRIAAKRLRYTLEIARPVYPGRLDEAIEATKRVQSLLGDVHDCDVWAGHLDAFALEERRRLIKLFGHAGRFARLLPGIDYLRQDRRDHRQAVFGQLVAYWAQLGQRRLWDSLRGAVLAHGQTADVTAGEPVVAEPAAAQPTSAAAGDATPDPVRVVVSEEASFDFGDPNARPRIDGTGRVRPPARKPLLTAGP